MGYSCYNALGGSLNVGDTGVYPLVLCIGPQLPCRQRDVTVYLEKNVFLFEISAVNFIVGCNTVSSLRKAS